MFCFSSRFCLGAVVLLNLLIVRELAASPRSAERHGSARSTSRPQRAAMHAPSSPSTASAKVSELDLGWKSLLEWQTEQALRHFEKVPQNQLSSFRLAWGYGVAYGQLSKFAESEKWFERAKQQYGNNSRMLSDFGFTYMSWGLYGARTAKKAQDQYDSARYFDAAESKFLEASRLAPNDSLPLTRLAMLHFYRGQYPQAWSLVKRSKQLGGEDLDSRFLNDLSKKMAEPK